MKNPMYTMIVIIINMVTISLAIGVVTTADTIKKLTDERDRAAETNRLLKIAPKKESISRISEAKDQAQSGRATQVIKVTDSNEGGLLPVNPPLSAGEVTVIEGLANVIAREDSSNVDPYYTRLKSALASYTLSIDNDIYKNALQLVSDYASVYDASKKEYNRLVDDYRWVLKYGNSHQIVAEKVLFQNGAKPALAVAKDMLFNVNKAISILMGLHDAAADNISDIQDAWKNNVIRYVAVLRKMAQEVQMYQESIMHELSST